MATPNSELAAQRMLHSINTNPVPEDTWDNELGPLTSAPELRRSLGQKIAGVFKGTPQKSQVTSNVSYPRLDASLDPGISSPLSNIEEQTISRKDSKNSFEKLQKDIQTQGIPYMLLNLLTGGALGAGKRARQANTAPPEPLNMPSPRSSNPLGPAPVDPRTPPFMPSSQGVPKGDAYKFTPKGGKEYIKRQENSANTTPDWVKDGAEHLGLRATNKQFEDASKQSNPLVDMLVKAGKSLAHRKQTGQNAPLTRESMQYNGKKSTDKRDWLDQFSGPIEP